MAKGEKRSPNRGRHTVVDGTAPLTDSAESSALRTVKRLVKGITPSAHTQRATSVSECVPPLEKGVSRKRRLDGEQHVGGGGDSDKHPIKKRKVKPADDGDDDADEEEDRLAAEEVLRQTSAFIQKLKPSVRDKFWNLREVSGGLASAADPTKAKKKKNGEEEDLTDLSRPSKKQQKLNQEEEEDMFSSGSSISSSEPSWITDSDDEDDDDDGEENNAEEDEEEEEEKPRKAVTKADLSRGGSLFHGGGGDVWSSDSD